MLEKVVMVKDFLFSNVGLRKDVLKVLKVK